MDLIPTLPSRFPCWVQAVYSWGGETKKDLGFVEGDLIECLNAGDGSWWMGRLRRDRRAIGLFPSNFVKVLPESFMPQSRSVSPAPETQPAVTPQKSKGTFRKPYQSYSTPPKQSPNRSLESSPASSRQNSLLNPHQSPSRQNSYQSKTQDSPSRQNSYQSKSQYSQSQYSQSQYSQSQSRYSYVSRGASPAPPLAQARSRDPSPSPLRYHESRAPSPGPYGEQGSSPPPPPPPHRVAYTQPPTRTHSPAPTATSRKGAHTPSPLRDAMDDVITSLEDMSVKPSKHHSESRPGRTSPMPWSPDTYADRGSPRKKTKPRPQTSMGIGLSNFDDFGRDPHRVYTEDVMLSNAPNDYHQRMEQRLRGMRDEPQYLHANTGSTRQESGAFSQQISQELDQGVSRQRPLSSMETHIIDVAPQSKLRNRKSAYELGKQAMARTMTLKSNFTNISSGTNTTNSSGSTQATRQSLMSGPSASGFSATSAGSLARRKVLGSLRRARPQSVAETRREDIYGFGVDNRPQTPLTGVSYHSSHATNQQDQLNPEWSGSVVDSGAELGGLAKLKPKRSGFFKKLVDSAKAGAASTRSSIASGGQEVSRNPMRGTLSSGIQGISSGSAAQDMGLGGGSSANKNNEWVLIRRDVNRSNSLSKIERQERRERCQMLGQPDVDSVDIFDDEVEGDQGADGRVVQRPSTFHLTNFQLVDKSARFINSLPPMTNPTSLAQGYVCRPYRSDVQRLRAVFTWVSEKISWEEDYEGGVDTRRVIQSRRGSTQEVAFLVMEMCQAVGFQCEVVHGYLKPPDELPSFETMPRPNHWWNFVVCDGEWRMMDCSLASPTNPRRSLYSTIQSSAAESFYFLARPTEACYTHIPMEDVQQHLVPNVDPAVLLALPCALPPYFRNGLRLHNYSTSLLYVEGLELMQISIAAPPDTEVFAEIVARSFARDADGDLFESGEITTKRALAQAEWKNGTKIFQIKALLPGDEGHGTLRVYAGKRGLMHSIKDNPHPLGLCLPIFHKGENPPFEFFTRHPTPHAQRHDLYLAQPQCRRLACNNTFVFNVRQHPSSPSGLESPTLSNPSGINRAASPMGIARPPSSLSMTSSQASGSNPSSTSYFEPGNAQKDPAQAPKPAKLAIQAPSGKILRLSKKIEGGFVDQGGTWETIIKVGEKGIWRGLVLADRSARWCVWGEWECV